MSAIVTSVPTTHQQLSLHPGRYIPGQNLMPFRW